MNAITRQARAHVIHAGFNLAERVKLRRMNAVQSSPRKSPASSLPAWPNAIGCLLLVAAVALAFQNGTSAPFMLDDEVSIMENESIRSLTPLSSALWPRTDVFTAGRPLLNLSFAVNHAIGGLNPRGYHVANILIHAGAALFLFGLVRRTCLLVDRPLGAEGRSFWIAFCASLLWAVHPLQTESVTYISQRAESLMGLCYFGTLYCFVRACERRAVGWAGAAVAWCGAGMLVKEVMITAPVVALLLDRTFIAGSFLEAWRRRRWLYVGLGATWIVLITLMVTTRIQDRGVGYVFNFSWHEYLRIEFTAVVRYLRLALWPFGLVLDYGGEIGVPSWGKVVLAGSFLAALAAASLMLFWRRSAVGFLGVCLFLVLAPTSSFLPVAGQPIAENRMYVPLATIMVFATVGAFAALRGRASVALAAVAVALSWQTIVRNHDYRSNLAIWTDTLQKRPGSARAWCYRGIALLNEGQVDPAIASFQAAVRIRPTYFQAHLNLASALLNRDRMDEAMRHFDVALRLKPTDPLAHSNFGTALFRAGRKEDALRQYQEAYKLRPGFRDARLNMGITLAHLGRMAEALSIFEELVRADPQYEPARSNLQQLQTVLQQQAAAKPL